MAIILLPIILMVLFEVEASHNGAPPYNNIIWNSTPSYVPPVNNGDRNDPWLTIKKEQLDRARMRSLEVAHAKSEYGLRGVESKMPNVNANRIQSGSRRPMMNLRPQRDQPKKLVYYRCYFNVVSCF